MSDDVKAAMKRLADELCEQHRIAGLEDWNEQKVLSMIEDRLAEHPAEQPIRSPEVWDQMEQANLDRDEPKEQLRKARGDLVAVGEQLAKARERIAELEQQLAAANAEIERLRNVMRSVRDSFPKWIVEMERPQRLPPIQIDSCPLKD